MKLLTLVVIALLNFVVVAALMAIATDAPNWAIFSVALLWGQASMHDLDRSMTAEGRW